MSVLCIITKSYCLQNRGRETDVPARIGTHTQTCSKPVVPVACGPYSLVPAVSLHKRKMYVRLTLLAADHPALRCTSAI